MVVIQSLARLAIRGWSFLTAEVLLPDPVKGSAKLLDAESINDWVDGGVAMREQNGNVNEKHWLLACRKEECDAVHNVKGKPANCEQEKN